MLNKKELSALFTASESFFVVLLSYTQFFIWYKVNRLLYFFRYDFLNGDFAVLAFWRWYRFTLIQFCFGGGGRLFYQAPATVPFSFCSMKMIALSRKMWYSSCAIHLNTLNKGVV